MNSEGDFPRKNKAVLVVGIVVFFFFETTKTVHKRLAKTAGFVLAAMKTMKGEYKVVKSFSFRRSSASAKLLYSIH